MAMRRRLPGAAKYISLSDQVTCNRCGMTGLAWAVNKQGRSYLCCTMPSQDDMRSHYGVRVVMPWNPHRCNKQ
jgi:hypothetical protein